jgi:acyl-CoA synthetase (AMP-forming)/AMP-acid ligase II
MPKAQAAEGIPRERWKPFDGLSAEVKKNLFGERMAAQGIYLPYVIENPTTPETRTLTPDEASDALRRDWLFQAMKRPLAERALAEIGWARALAARLAKDMRTPSLTSDLAELEAGRVYLRGRATEQINVAGRKVSPAWIESKLAQHPAVRECLVFGVPSGDAGRGEAIVACVAANAGATREQLKQFLLDRLASWQVPREWIFVQALPTNERGKLSRAEWRNRFLAERRPRGS